MTVNCGSCMACKIRRSQHWAIRCVHEAQHHKQSCFITLTYDQAHLPKDGGLDVTHWQKFAKRLRKKMGPFRFLHCGEYGEENFRPHYHACIFGLDFHEDRKRAEGKSKHPMWTSGTLEKIWGQGFTTIGDLTKATANYTAQYILKKQKQDTEQYQRINTDTGECYAVKAPYITMSRRPGLGHQWIKTYTDDVYPDDFIVHENKKCSVPKFYNNYLEGQDPERYKAVQAKRKRKGITFSKNDTPDRKEARRYILEQRNKQNTRTI